MGERQRAIILIFRLMAGGLNFKADRNRMRTVLYSTVQYCTVLYSTVQHCRVLYITVQYYTALYSTVQYCTALYSTVQYCTTVQYSTVQYSTVQYCTVLKPYKAQDFSNNRFFEVWPYEYIESNAGNFTVCFCMFGGCLFFCSKSFYVFGCLSLSMFFWIFMLFRGSF